MAFGPITAWQIGEKVEVVKDFLFLGSKTTVDDDYSHEKIRQLFLGRKAMTNLDSVLKSKDITLLAKVHIVRAMVFPMVMNSCESWTIKKGRTPKNWCLQTVGLEKTPESPLDSKKIKLVNLKGDQPWIFTGRTNVEAKASVFWSSDANRWLIGQVTDAEKDWGQKEKRTSEDEMTGWHQWCNKHELGQTPGDGKGQKGLACYSPWSCKESDTTGWLNNNKNHKNMCY